MATYPAVYDQLSSDTGPTTALWQNFPANHRDDPRHGFVWFEDFFTIGDPVLDYTLTPASTGTFNLKVAAGVVGNIGVAELDSGSTTATQGPQVQYDGLAVLAAAGRKIGFETRLKVVDSATGPEFFAGLSKKDLAILDTSAMASTDVCAFSSITDNNVLLMITEDGGTPGNAATSPHTLVEDTYVKLGFLIDGLDTVTVYVDGVVTDVGAFTPEISATEAMMPTLICQSGGSSVDPLLNIDWFKVGTYA